MLYLLPDDDELPEDPEELEEEDPEDEELELDEPDEKLLDEEDEDLVVAGAEDLVVAGAEDLEIEGAGVDLPAAEPGATLPPSERRAGAGATTPLLWFGLLVLYEGLVLILGLL
jgi:hypothetical protein